MCDSVAADIPERPWSRHELLRIAPPLWSQALASRPDLAAMPLLGGWADRGWPVIVRRRTVGERPDHVPLGVPLPPAAGKLRIALTVPEAAALERLPPAALSIVEPTADRTWWSAIDALVALGARLAVTPTSFGSLLWEHETGLRYLSGEFDLDVLLYAHRGCDLHSLLAGIAGIERTAPMRIDGEIVFADGSAVNWRELRAAVNGETSGAVMVKSIDQVRLANVSQLPNLRRAA